MSSSAKNTRASIMPCLRYRDAPKAIEWLCSVFGFEKQLVVPRDHEQPWSTQRASCQRARRR